MKRLLSLFLLVLLTGCLPTTGTTSLNPGYDIVQVNSNWEDAGCVVTISNEEYEMDTNDTVDVTTLGETQIVYTYETESETYSCKRVVKVVDNTDPFVTLIPGIDTIVVGNEFVDAGIEAEDNYSTELDIQVDSNVNTDVIGTYSIVYTVTDESDNTTTVVRMVTIVNE